MMQAPQSKEEKQLDTSLDDLIYRVRELKQSIAGFIYKLENEYQTLTWPNMMEHFGVLSSQLNSVKRLLKTSKMPLLRNYVLFPILLSPDRDMHLEKLTEGRVVAFSHEVVPDYLRTKPEPEVEERVQVLSVKASSISTEATQKQLTMLNKITANLIDTISASSAVSEERDKDPNLKNILPQTSNPQETNLLIGAITKGHRLLRPEPPTQMVVGPQMGQMQPQMQQQHAQKLQMAGAGMGRMPSAIKTNIKAAASSHPYQRP